MLQTIGTIGATFIVLTAISGLVMSWHRGGVGHVKLTPAIVENADILATRRFEWDDVVDVTDHADSQSSRRAVVLRLRNGHEEIVHFANVYVPHGVALYWMVRHYWRHPEDRMEMVDSISGNSPGFDHHAIK